MTIPLPTILLASIISKSPEAEEYEVVLFTRKLLGIEFAFWLEYI